MADIRWTKELHYITSDSIKPEDWNADAFRSFLNSAMVIFRELYDQIEKIRYICGDKERHGTLAVFQNFSQVGHERLKSFLPHEQSAETLFLVARETEGLLRFIIATAITEVEKREAPRYLKNELIEIEDRVTTHCERALAAMGYPIQTPFISSANH